MKKSKVNIQKLIDDIDWLMVEPNRSYGLFAPDQISVGFYPHKSGGDDINQVRIRLGRDVIKKLGWKTSDKIHISNHPDDLMLFRLCNPGTKNGWSLSAESSGPHFRISFRWPHPLKLEFTKTKVVKYEIYKNQQILFKVGSEDFFEG